MVAMTGNQAVARVQQILGWRGDKSTEILEHLQSAQDAMELGTSLPWFLEQQQQTLAVTSGAATTNLPSGFIRISVRPHHLSLQNAPVFLRQGPYEELYARFASTDPGYPAAFALRTSDLYWFPTPNVTFNLTWSYYKHDDAVAGGASNLWLTNTPLLLVGMAAKEMAKAFRNAQAVGDAQDLINLWRPKAFAHSVEREAEDRPYYMNGESS